MAAWKAIRFFDTAKTGIRTCSPDPTFVSAVPLDSVVTNLALNNGVMPKKPSRALLIIVRRGDPPQSVVPKVVHERTGTSLPAPVTSVGTETMRISTSPRIPAGRAPIRPVAIEISWDRLPVAISHSAAITVCLLKPRNRFFLLLDQALSDHCCVIDGRAGSIRLANRRSPKSHSARHLMMRCSRDAGRDLNNLNSKFHQHWMVTALSTLLSQSAIVSRNRVIDPPVRR